MSIEIQSPFNSSWNNPLATNEKILKEYTLAAGGIFKILYDSIKGARGILLIEGREVIVPFQEFIGIPKNLKFHEAKLSSFLENTYLSVRRSEEGIPFGVVINHRLMGGGGGHSTHSQSYHYTSPPPPISTHVNYSAGFPIRSLYLEPQIAGTYTNSKFEPGDVQFSVTFQSHEAGARPNVIIHVWKKDYYSAQISQLQAAKAKLVQEQTVKSQQKHIWEETKGNIVNMLRSLKEHQDQLRAMLESEKQAAEEMEAIDKEIETSVASQKGLQEEMRQYGPDSRSLIDLLPIVDNLGIGISGHEAIRQFRGRDAAKDSLISSTGNPNGLLGKMLTSLNAVAVDVAKAEGKNIIALAGNTGTGKSTAVNFLLGIPMQSKRTKQGVIVEVAEGHLESAKIGHYLTTSETLHTQVHGNNQVPYLFADCGGFFDTRGISTDVSVAASLKFMLEKAKSVKLVVCFDSRLLTNDRGTLFYQSINLALKGMLKDYRKHAGSVLLMLTKPTMNLDNTVFSTKEACQLLTEMMKDLPDGSEQKELYQFLLWENGKNICVCDPLSVECRSEIYRLFDQMTEIDSAAHPFLVACSPQAQTDLLGEMIRIAVKTNELYASHACLQGKIEQQRAKQQTLKVKLAELQELKKKHSLGVDSAEEFLKQNTVYTVTQSLKVIQQQADELQNQIAQHDAQIAEKDNQEIIIYQSTGGSWTVSDRITGVKL